MIRAAALGAVTFVVAFALFVVVAAIVVAPIGLATAYLGPVAGPSVTLLYVVSLFGACYGVDRWRKERES